LPSPAPFFALVLLGWIAARAGPLPESAIPGLNAYVLFFALPCMLFRFGPACRWLACRSGPARHLPRRGLADGGVDDRVTVRTRRRPRRVDLRDAAFGALVAAFPNSGFMACPCWSRCSAMPPPAPGRRPGHRPDRHQHALPGARPGGIGTIDR
jgi:hypothetical protein